MVHLSNRIRNESLAHRLSKWLDKNDLTNFLFDHLTKLIEEIEEAIRVLNGYIRYLRKRKASA